MQSYELGGAAHAMRLEVGEDARLARGPGTQVGFACREEALGVPAPLAGYGRFADDLRMPARRHVEPGAAVAT